MTDMNDFLSPPTFSPTEAEVCTDTVNNQKENVESTLKREKPAPGDENPSKMIKTDENENEEKKIVKRTAVRNRATVIPKNGAPAQENEAALLAEKEKCVKGKVEFLK